MKYRSRWLLTSTMALGLLALPVLASGATYYVDADTGTDSGDCSAACKTIGYAAANVPAGTAADPSIIEVAAGLYDTSTNGETFPIGFDNDYVSLSGAGAATTTIDAENSHIDALQVDAKGFSASGFTFDNAGRAIDISGGGFTVSNNTFNTTTINGVYCDWYKENLDEDYAVGNMSFTNNTVNSSNYGVYIYISLDYNEFIPSLTASIGTLDISNNTFEGNDFGVYMDDIYITDMYNGTATLGNVTFDTNTFTDCSYGIYFDDFYIDDMYGGSTATIGDLLFTNNTMDNCSNDGIYVYGMWLDNFYDSTGTLGDMTFTDNTVKNGGSTGFDINYYGIESFEENSSGTAGNVTITGNTITGCSSYGIDFYEMYAYDIENSTVTLGNVLIDDNEITGGSYGIYFYEFYADYLVGSSVTMGSFTISNCTLEDQTSYGLYVDYWSVWDLYGPSSATLGNFNITGNTVTTTVNSGRGLHFDSLYYISDIEDTSTVNMGTINITGNTVNSHSEALRLYYDGIGDDLGDYSSETPIVTTGPTNITGNKFTSTGDEAAYIEYDEIGYYTYGKSKVFMGATTIATNTFDGYYEGLEVYFTDCGADMAHESELVWNPITVKNNIFTSAQSDAFSIEYDDSDNGADNEDNSRAQLPDWIITGNTFATADGATGLYYENQENPYYLEDHAHVDFGSILIDNNTFNPDKNSGMSQGIELNVEDACYDCEDYSTTVFGDVTISNNKFYTMTDEAIYLDYDGFPDDVSNAATFTAGDFSITDNLIEGADKGIYIIFEDVDTYDFSKVTLGELTVADNNITGVTGAGIDVNWDAENFDPSTATVAIGKTLLLDNIATASTTFETAGIWIDGDIGPDVAFAAPEVNGNTVSGFGVGLGFDDLPEASMSCNTVENSGEFGLFFLSSGNFTAIYNSLVDNGLGLKISTGDSAIVMAENNWWGDKDGPVACTSCNKIDAGTGTVDFDPWLKSAPRSQCSGFSWPMFIPAITGAGR